MSSLCNITPPPNTTYHGGVRNALPSYFHWCLACAWWRGGWAPVNCFLLIFLFSIFPLLNYKGIFNLYFVFNLIRILLIFICFLLYSIDCFLQFRPSSFNLIFISDLILILLIVVCLFLILFSNWILFLISPLSTWFQIIFISNLVPILLFVFFFLFWILFLLH